MAQLKDSVVTGNLRITDMTFTDTLQATTIKAPSTSGGTTYSAGTNGQVLRSNGTTTFWGNDIGTTYSAGTGLSLSGTTFNHSNSVTAVTTAGMLKVKYDAQGHITGSSAFASADVSSLINLLGTGSSNPELADYYIAQYANGGTTTTTYHRRPVSALWNTLKALITVTTTGDGNAITSASIGNDGNNRKITFTKDLTFSLDGHTHSNYLGAVLTGSYYGMAKPDGTATGDASWIRTTFKGIIPYAANDDATNGLKSQLGTSTWTFAAGHINNLYYKDLKPITVVAGGTADNGIDKMAGSYFFSGDNLFNAGESIDWVGLQAGYSLDKWQIMGTGVKGLLYRQNDSGGSNTENWNSWQMLMTPQAVTGSSGITATITTTTIGTGENAYVYNSGVQISHSNSVTAVTTAAFKKYTYDAQGHITGSADVAASDLPSHTHLYAGSSTAGGAATNVATTVTNGSTTLTNYALTYVADPTVSESNVVRKSNDLRVSITNGTTSSGGTAELVIGNNKNTTTADNKQGKISLYSSSTSYHTLAVTATSSAITHTFPATSGTVLNSGTTSFTRNLTSGTKIGSIKINGTSTDIYCETNVWTAMTGATSSADGTVGYINSTPPKTGYNTKYWRADGSWSVPVESSSTNGKIKINGTETTVYTHPTATAQSSGLYVITVNGTGHVTAATAVTKTDIPALDYLPNTTLYAAGNSAGGAAMGIASDDCETTTGIYYPIAHKQNHGQYVSTATAVFSRSCLFSNQVNNSSANLFTVVLGSHHESDITVGAVEMYSDSGWQTRVRSTSTTFRNIWLPDAEGTLITSEQVVAGYVPLTGSTDMSGIFQANGNSAAFAVVNADSDRRLGLHIGSGGENRGLYDWGGSTYTAGVGDWVFRIDAENRVGIRATLLESSTANNGMPIPVLGGTPETATKNIYNSDGFRINLQSGTTSAAGKAELVLGNSKSSTTEGNKQGQLSLYSTSTSYHRIQGASTSTSKTWTLPAIPGITVNGSASHTNVFAANRYSIIYDDTSHASTPWYKFAEITITTTYEDHIITFLVSNGWCDSSQTVGGMTGILTAHVRTGSAKTHDSANSNAAMELKWNLACSNINPEDYVMVYTDTANTSCKVELWCKMTKQYDSRIFQVLKEHKRREIGTYWTLIRNDGRARAANYTTGTGTVTSSLCTIKNPTA